jgi:hypothetical protein
VLDPVDGDQTNTSAATTNNQALVTVVGDYKPSRVTASITHLTVPAAGLPISITRAYDSLERSRVEEFGNGWPLSTSVHLELDSSENVSLTIGGSRCSLPIEPWARPASSNSSDEERTA